MAIVSKKLVQSALKCLLTIFPFFIGPITASIPLARGFIEPYMERYSYFLLIFILWMPLVAMALKVKSSLALNQHLPRLVWAALLVLIALALIVLGFVRSKLPLDTFYIIVFSLGAITLGRATNEMGRAALSMVFEFIGFISIGYSSFLLTTFNWTWQPLLVCLGVACMLSAERIASRIVNYNLKSSAPLPSVKSLIRIQLVLLSAGPVFFAALCYIGQLERSYLAVLLTLLWTERLIRSCAAISTDSNIPQSWLEETRGIVGLFIVINTLLALV